MFWIAITGLAGFSIGLGTGVYIMWPYRDKYRVCNTERRSTELMLSQATPRRDETGRFAKKVAA
jgi:hypothetical protein